MLAVHLLLFDETAIKQDGLTPRDGGEYLALHGALTKTLVKLELRGAGDEPKRPGLAEILASYASKPQSEPEERAHDACAEVVEANGAPSRI